MVGSTAMKRLGLLNDHSFWQILHCLGLWLQQHLASHIAAVFKSAILYVSCKKKYSLLFTEIKLYKCEYFFHRSQGWPDVRMLHWVILGLRWFKASCKDAKTERGVEARPPCCFETMNFLDRLNPVKVKESRFVMTKTTFDYWSEGTLIWNERVNAQQGQMV